MVWGLLLAVLGLIRGFAGPRRGDGPPGDGRRLSEAAIHIGSRHW